MRPTASPARKRWRKRKVSELKRKALFFFSIVAVAVLVDLWSKDYMWGMFDRRGDSVIEVTGWLNWAMAYNPGMAFSIFREYPQLLVIFAGGVTPILAIVALRTSVNSKVLGMWALIVGGAFGNVWDRVRSRMVYDEPLHWAVRDFIDVHWQGRHWPTFNAADSFICIGVAYLVLWSFVEEKNEQA